MTKKKIFTIAGIAVGAVIVIGIVIWLIFFRGGSVAPSDPNEMVYVTSVADITGTGSLGMTAKYSGVVEAGKDALRAEGRYKENRRAVCDGRSGSEGRR